MLRILGGASKEQVEFMSSILGLPDEGRDALMSAALDPPHGALDS